MTTKRTHCCVLLTIICCSSAFAQVGKSCVVASTGVRGVCRLASNCRLAEEQAQNGISPTICGYYQLTIPIVCCESEFAEPNDDTLLNREPDRFDTGDQPSDLISYPEQTSRPQSHFLRKSEEKCQEYSKAITGVVQATPLLIKVEAISMSIVKCEYNSVALIVGGTNASAGEFPFMAALGFYEENKVKWRCGGTLISEEYVLTAAHCTFTRDGDGPKVVRLGDLDLVRNDDGSIYADYNIQNIVVHPNYRYPQKYNDIALIRLSGSVTFTKFIRPACLYTRNELDQSVAIATGWGKTDYAAANTSDRLMKVTLHLYKNEHCAQTYRTEKKKNLPRGIVDSMLCAGDDEGDRDTCQGDSGSPLLVTKPGNQCKFYVIGITSFGKACGQANTPAIYTRVSEFVPWIERTIW